jgi:hypothetical protein
MLFAAFFVNPSVVCRTIYEMEKKSSANLLSRLIVCCRSDPTVLPDQAYCTTEMDDVFQPTSQLLLGPNPTRPPRTAFFLEHASRVPVVAMSP